MSQMFAFISMPGGWEWLVILVVGLLIFGRRLPEVARSVGKSIVEFKKGLHDVKGEIDVASSVNEASRLPPAQPKSEPLRAEPATQTPPMQQTPPQG